MTLVGLGFQHVHSPLGPFFLSCSALTSVNRVPHSCPSWGTLQWESMLFISTHSPSDTECVIFFSPHTNQFSDFLATNWVSHNSIPTLTLTTRVSTDLAGKGLHPADWCPLQMPITSTGSSGYLLVSDLAAHRQFPHSPCQV